MSDEVAVVRTRRAVLAAALGAGAASVAGAVSRPAPVAATTGDNFLIGVSPGSVLDGTGPNQASASTSIFTTVGIGFRGISAAVNHPGLEGRSTAVTGLGNGVYGESSAPTGHGVQGYDSATTGLPVGVGGVATGPTGIGVTGESLGGAAAVGVYGKGSGAGVRAESSAGVALDVLGKAKFSRSGRASVVANAKYVDVTVPGGLTAHSLVHATIQTYRAGVSIVAARPNWPSAGKIRIYFNKVASTTSSTPVAWMVTEY